MKKLTLKQIHWLKTHGGRTIRHLHEDEKGLFVLMYSPFEASKTRKIYLPEDGDGVY